MIIAGNGLTLLPSAEVQIMRNINHPNIVKLISFSESTEHYFLVMECKLIGMACTAVV